jgi:hypothetical protein
MTLLKFGIVDSQAIHLFDYVVAKHKLLLVSCLCLDVRVIISDPLRKFLNIYYVFSPHFILGRIVRVTLNYLRMLKLLRLRGHLCG